MSFVTYRVFDGYQICGDSSLIFKSNKGKQSPYMQLKNNYNLLL